jgi:hypothetical protein
MDAVNDGTINTAINTANSTKTLLGKYMDNPEKLSSLYQFLQTTTGGGSKWFVGFDLANTSAELKEKLASKAASTGLLGSANKGTAPGLTTNYATTHGAVWMVAR